MQLGKRDNDIKRGRSNDITDFTTSTKPTTAKFANMSDSTSQRSVPRFLSVSGKPLPALRNAQGVLGIFHILLNRTASRNGMVVGLPDGGVDFTRKMP
jgi:hypothetical protein